MAGILEAEDEKSDLAIYDIHFFLVRKPRIRGGKDAWVQCGALAKGMHA